MERLFFHIISVLSYNKSTSTNKSAIEEKKKKKH